MQFHNLCPFIPVAYPEMNLQASLTQSGWATKFSFKVHFKLPVFKSFTGIQVNVLERHLQLWCQPEKFLTNQEDSQVFNVFY